MCSSGSNGSLRVKTLSRGQQKLVAVAMVLAQLRLVPETAPNGPPCCWMILRPSSMPATRGFIDEVAQSLQLV